MVLVADIFFCILSLKIIFGGHIFGLNFYAILRGFG